MLYDVPALVALGENRMALFDCLSAVQRNFLSESAPVNQNRSTVEVRSGLSLLPKGPGAWV